MVTDPSHEYSINGTEQTSGVSGGSPVFNEDAVKAKVDKPKAYLVQKFNLNVDRIVTKASEK